MFAEIKANKQGCEPVYSLVSGLSIIVTWMSHLSDTRNNQNFQNGLNFL